MKTDHRDPMKHKTGKPRLGPLNLDQLRDLLEKSSKPKDKARIKNRIRLVTQRMERSGNIEENLAVMADALNETFADELKNK